MDEHKDKVPSNITYGLVPQSHLDAAIRVELASYHAEEAASLQSFTYRQANAPDLFLGAYNGAPAPETLIGYIVATLSEGAKLTHESMAKNVPTGTSACIHSVCVTHDWRKKGVGLALMREYVSRLRLAVQEGKNLERVLLICHDYMVDFYKKAGFEMVGKSDVVHGPGEWWEMKVDLTVPKGDGNTGEPVGGAMPPGLFEALSKKPTLPSSQNIRRLEEFPSLKDLLNDDVHSGQQTNKFKVVCPREGCRSLILLPDIAKWVEAASVQIDSPTDPPSAHILPPLPPVPETMNWWLIAPSPMQFENIGFSKPVGSPSSQMKLLSCAECDLGPLGWSVVGGKEFWLAGSRVAYIVPTAAD